jgi:tetratricopeptide (TPR) repeat protein
LDDLARYSEAITIFSRAEKIFRQQSDMVGIARAIIYRSVALRMMGQAEDALRLAKEGLGKLERLMAVDIHIMAWAIRNRGIAYLIIGQTSKALRDLERCLPLFERIGDTYYILEVRPGIKEMLHLNLLISSS